MKKNLLLMLIFISNFSFGHPGIGIVKDRKGNIYYTDLHDVWKSTPAGKKSIAVRNVHTHELYIDEADNLYGEHLWYNGEKVNTWGHYVWRLRSNNTLDTVIRPTAGFLQNYSFVRDENANMYWVERDTVYRFKKRSPDGSITTIQAGKFKDVGWMYATKQGIVYFIDFVENIIDAAVSSNRLAGRHRFFGLWGDAVENIYVADFSGGGVKRISPAGKIEDFVYSATPWSPTGGLFDNAGNLWLLETSLTNNTRIRKITPAELNTVMKPAIYKNYFLPFSVILILIILLLRFGKLKQGKKSVSSLLQ